MERFSIPDEQAVYAPWVFRLLPIECNLPFHCLAPYAQEKGNEYFILCDSDSRFACKKAVKVSFRKPQYVHDGLWTGKKKWY